MCPTPPAPPPRASIYRGAQKSHLTLKSLPAHRPPSHRGDVPAPGRDLALNGCRESCLLEINCLLLESCSLQSLGSDTLSLKIINYLTVRLLPLQHAALAAPHC